MESLKSFESSLTPLGFRHYELIQTFLENISFAQSAKLRFSSLKWVSSLVKKCIPRI